MSHLFTTALAAALSVAMAAVYTPAAAATPGVDDGYRVTGDPAAAPIQAFRIGETLYLQIPNVQAVPAPIGAAGPLRYKMYGHYMILPNVAAVTLHYGSATAYVVRDGATALGANGGAVVSVSAPVDAAHQLPVVVPPSYARPPQETAPVYLPPSQHVSSVPGGGVTGTIASSGAEGGAGAEASPFKTVAGEGVGATGGNEWSGAQDTGPSLVARIPRGSGVVTIVADGTVAGARAANATMQACLNHQLACQVQYKGAPSGLVKLVGTGVAR